jgi:hypothetical protein
MVLLVIRSLILMTLVVEMMFELEPEGKGRGESEAAEGAIITLLDQPAKPHRTSQPRRTSARKPPTDSTGLPQSFSALRPASLPVPSNIAPPRRGPSPPADPVESISEEDDAEEEAEEEVDEELDSRDQEIRKLVAADTPSHRGRWKKDSVEWNRLVSPHRHPSVDDDDYDEDIGPPPGPHVNGTVSPDVRSDPDAHALFLFLGSSQAGMPGSMPINIRPIVSPRAHLTLASYRPQTMPPAAQPEPGPEPEPLVPSSSVRRAVYAERDLQRARDPGALDFAADDNSVIEEEEEEGENGNEDTTVTSPEAATVSASVDKPETLRGGRKRALKILQARSDLPDSGMWRSLAS